MTMSLDDDHDDDEDDSGFLFPPVIEINGNVGMEFETKALANAISFHLEEIIIGKWLFTFTKDIVDICCWRNAARLIFQSFLYYL